MFFWKKSTSKHINFRSILQKMIWNLIFPILLRSHNAAINSKLDKSIEQYIHTCLEYFNTMFKLCLLYAPETTTKKETNVFFHMDIFFISLHVPFYSMLLFTKIRSNQSSNRELFHIETILYDISFEHMIDDLWNNSIKRL